MNEIRIEKVDRFRYLEVDIDRDGGIKSEIQHIVNEGEKVCGILRKIYGKEK
jgi:hypothetical protein